LMIALEIGGSLKSYATTGSAWGMHLAVAVLLGLSASVFIPALLALLHQHLPLSPCSRQVVASTRPCLSR